MTKFPRLSAIFSTIILLLYVALCGKELLIETGSYVYLLQTAVFTIAVLQQPNNRYYIFSPSFISLLYLNLNFIVGHHTVSRGFGLSLTYYHAFNNYSSIQFITAFFLLCNLMVFCAIPFKSLRSLSPWAASNQKGFSSLKLIFLFAVLFLFGFIHIDLSFIGGGGDFSYVYKLVIAIFITLTLVKMKTAWKYLLYLIMVSFFMIGHYDSKREIIYVIILVVFLEIMYNRIDITVSFKQLTLGILGVLGFFYIVTISSIMRGYGNYETESFSEAAGYVPDYVQSDLFMDAFTANFETNSVYGNSTNAINYIYTGRAELTYGTTMVRFLFLPLPRSVFPNKPNGIIDAYTMIFAPQFRAIGGSFPVIVYSEVFWNFHIFGLFFLLFIFLWINRLYVSLLKKLANNDEGILAVFLVFMFVTLLQFIRGSGFEIWLVYGLLSIPLISIIFILRRIKNERS
ncbi:hypothetical protein [Sphingobacterium sp. SGR-19]|uniref:hypothetical protein n=1 Tax=Sphingobacterium sp. SGR-19 TaxID=2710886 RepID=UPI0013EC1D9C|nr:hypothetical protein [Sphingobacterium sp. SGR-19]NGM67222.1 hypothetical protein [Sphingobacterium sp. SGR-19]